ncbi:MAG: ribosomal-processing cysteine protease Prp [Eubacteriales bacterium]|nr:ribosomal-processing cysteine protease Prp [Eubacteriales bacterium]
MMTIKLSRTASGLIRRFTVTGHAGYGAYGSDILCAGVSAIAQTVIGSLQDLAGLEPDYVLAGGDIRCELPDLSRLQPHQLETARVLMESMAVGCRQIAASYGPSYIRIKEVRYHQKGGARA